MNVCQHIIKDGAKSQFQVRPTREGTVEGRGGGNGGGKERESSEMNTKAMSRR